MAIHHNMSRGVSQSGKLAFPRTKARQDYLVDLCMFFDML
jgi:hypothetical protein